LVEVVKGGKMTDELGGIDPRSKVQLANGINECEEEKCYQIGRINPKKPFKYRLFRNRL
jgi:hypothetical protein